MFGPCRISAVPRKQNHGASQARDETECSRSEPYAHVLSKLTGRAEIAELRMEFVSGQAIVHCRLLCRFSSQNGRTLDANVPNSARPLAAHRKCALAIANYQSEIASIGPEDKLPFGPIKLTKSLVLQ
jgi:hypothetical protein